MQKIVVVRSMHFTPEQKKRLESFGDVIYHNDVPTPEQWLERSKDADVICSGRAGMEQKVYDLKDKFISLPFTGVGFLDIPRLKENNIQVSKSPGCNKDAVAEWIIAMMINLLRKLPEFIDIEELQKEQMPEATLSLTDKTVAILGKGHVGERVGNILKAFDANIEYFTRDKDLIETVKDADVVVNCLSSNPNSKGLLDKGFFNSLKKGAYFISITEPAIYDVDALIGALDNNQLAGAADDCGGTLVGNPTDPFYIRLRKHPKVLVTPHIAFASDVSMKMEMEMMIDNVEAYVKGKPIHLLW